MKHFKYSRQREIIYQTVADNPVHPTAETVYNMLKGENPHLSLGTVYRNLQQLAENGDILRLSIPDMPDRYDGNTDRHYHSVCVSCGVVGDIFMEYFSDLDRAAERASEVRVISHEALFHVICDKCSNKNLA